MIPTVYLSENGIAEALRFFERFESKASIDEGFDFSEADWSDFDKIYLDLYRLSLLHREGGRADNKLRSRNDDRFAEFRAGTSKQDRIVQVECLLDMHLEGTDEKRHLLSEFAVHSLINFRIAFAKTVRFQSMVTYVDVGCIIMGFGVRLPNVNELADARQEDAKEVGRKIVRERLSTKRWTDITRRFRVTQSYVDGAPL